MATIIDRKSVDKAQAKPGGGYGSCILPPEMLKRYQDVGAKDPTRPAFLNFGQAVVNEPWPGRGDFCSGHYEHYAEYIKGADVVSYDVYPVNEKLPLWWVGRGIDRLRANGPSIASRSGTGSRPRPLTPDRSPRPIT